MPDPKASCATLSGMAKEHCEKGVLPAPEPTTTADPCRLVEEAARAYCEGKTTPAPAENPCAGIVGDARDLCEKGVTPGGPPGGADGLTGGASDHVKELADWLLTAIQGLLAPDTAWAPEKIDSVLYTPFLWLGQNLAIAIFMCVVVVCGLTAWQGAPRLRQMGASTGWTLAAVVGMASVPGIVTMLHQAVSDVLRKSFDAGEGTLFEVIRKDLDGGTGFTHPLGLMLITAALCVALAFAALVYAVRQPAILVLVCIAPLVIASLSRGGDMGAVKQWANRLLGLLFCPFIMLLLLPFVPLAKGNLVLDTVLLIAADALMLRMIFHGVPYVGPRIARAARAMVERQTDNRLVRGVVRAGVPDTYEQENTPRGPRTVDTPGRAIDLDRSVVLAAYGIQRPTQPGRLTVESTVDRINADRERTARLTEARREARRSSGGTPPTRSATPGTSGRTPSTRSAAPGPSGTAVPTPPAAPRPSGGTPPTP